MNTKNKLLFILQALFSFCCFSMLSETDAYYTPYLICFGVSLLFIYINSENCYSFIASQAFTRQCILIFSSLFSMLIVLSNYSLWAESEGIRFFKLGIILFGSWISFFNIFYGISSHINSLYLAAKDYRISSLPIGVLSFIIISSIHMLILFLCKYPGNLSYDSIAQISQIITNTYTNHHPFYHTITIKFFIWLGMSLFDDINVGVCMYSVFQILFMSACFSFAIDTLEKLQMSRRILIALIIYFSLMPFHIMYSCTMWKDVPFSGFSLLLIIFLFRCLYFHRTFFNCLGFFISGIGLCLFRSNGFFVFLFTCLIFLFTWKFQEKSLLLLMFSIILISFFMKHSLLNRINVSQPDIAESLSIPLQQICRVVVDHNDLSEDESALLNDVIEVQQIPDYYLSYISDPMKILLRGKGNEDLLSQNKSAYLKLYISLGLRHPFTYLKAWIDQTKGYWNSGYSYWVWTDEVRENDYGIIRSSHLISFNNICNRYLSLFSTSSILQLFVSIGLHVWLLLICLFISLLKRDRIGVTLCIPTLATILSLLIATPVFAEFRYAYSLFCTLPFLLPIALRPKSAFEPN